MNPYPAYRPSGVEWLGDVPEHWATGHLRRWFAIVNGGTPSSSEEAYWDGETVWLTPDDLGQNEGAWIAEGRRTITEDGLRNSSARVSPPGSIILSTRAPIGHLAIASVPAATNQGCRTLVPCPLADSRFGYYTLLAGRRMLQSLGKGSTFMELTPADLGNLRLPLPPLDEQRSIAAFLDRETERIDTLVAKKRQLIERLQEYRTALITRTVTRGLPPNAARAAGLDPSPRLKASGIEWLGNVPEHWEVKPLHTLTEPHRPIIYGIVLPGPHVDEGVPIVKGGDVRERVAAGVVGSNTTFELDESHARSRLVAGDLVFAIRGSVGDVAEVPAPLHGANITQDAARIAPLAEVNSTWLKQFLASDLAKDQVQANALGATISGINIRDLRRVLVPTPPRREQERIATYLAAASARLDGLQDRAAIAVERLQEYRTALTTAAVTGKVDVRGVVAESGPVASG